MSRLIARSGARLTPGRACKDFIKRHGERLLNCARHGKAGIIDIETSVLRYALHDCLIMLRGSCHYQQKIVDASQNMMASYDFRRIFNKILKHALALPRKLQNFDLREIKRQAKQRFKINQGMIALNDLGVLHLAHSFPASRGRQANFFAHLLFGDAAAVVKRTENFQVKPVETSCFSFGITDGFLIVRHSPVSLRRMNQ